MFRRFRVLVGWVFVLVAAGVVAAAVACTARPAEPSTIRGRVVEAGALRPVEGAVVLLQARRGTVPAARAVTGPDGTFELVAEDLRSPASIVARADGFVTAEHWIGAQDSGGKAVRVRVAD